MRAIVFDTELSSLIFEDEVNTLRLCYLIADSICVGGQSGTNLTYVRDAKEFNIKKKILCLISSEIASNNFDHENRLAILNNFLIEIKEMQAIRYPSMTQLIPYNGSVRHFTKYFNVHFSILYELWKEKGYLDIVSLKENDSNIETTITEFSVGEWTQSLKSAPLNAKRILGLIFPKSPLIPSLLVFPKQFFIDKDTEGENPIEELNLVSNFSFPDTTTLTALQLKVIREQLKESGHLFRKDLDDWIHSFGATSKNLVSDYPINPNLDKSLQLFQTGIETNQMLIDNQGRLNLNAVTFTIKIGVTPVQRVWKYYRQYKILDDFTINELIKQTSTDSLYPKCLPFMSISPDYVYKERMDKLDKVDEEEISTTHKRKFIEF